MLITGAAGFLGWNLARLLSAEGFHVTACYHNTPPDRLLDASWRQLSLESRTDILSIATQPYDCLINCAAIADKKRCAEHPQTARKVNVTAPTLLAELCARTGAVFIHISTDLVFDGRRGWYREDDVVSPESLYAETKVLSEHAVLNATEACYILRTALMYGRLQRACGGFLRWTIDAVSRGTTLSLYTNQFRTPLYVPDVAHVITGLLRTRPPTGIYHLAGPDRYNRHEIGILAAETLCGHTGSIRPALLPHDTGCHVDDVSLRSGKVCDVLGMTFTRLPEGLAVMRDDIRITGQA